VEEDVEVEEEENQHLRILLVQKLNPLIKLEYSS
jgi:hypothetical protein